MTINGRMTDVGHTDQVISQNDSMRFGHNDWYYMKSDYSLLK